VVGISGLQDGEDVNCLKEIARNVMAGSETPIVFTESAALKVAELLAEENNPSLKLRVYITGGGCSGFQYGFTFDDKVAEDDTVIEKCGVTVVIDSMSLPYLQGAEIDYKEDLAGARFVIRNPNAQTTCGCGSSFSV
jgi:iron-sulfur cluster insertion protein